MEILKPAELMDDAEANDGDSLLLAEHSKPSSESWQEEVKVGSGCTLLVEGEQSEEEEDGREKLCSSNSSGHCFCVDRVDGKE